MFLPFLSPTSCSAFVIPSPFCSVYNDSVLPSLVIPALLFYFTLSPPFRIPYTCLPFLCLPFILWSSIWFPLIISSQPQFLSSCVLLPVYSYHLFLLFSSSFLLSLTFCLPASFFLFTPIISSFCFPHHFFSASISTHLPAPFFLFSSLIFSSSASPLPFSIFPFALLLFSLLCLPRLDSRLMDHYQALVWAASTMRDARECMNQLDHKRREIERERASWKMTHRLQLNGTKVVP